MFANTVFFSLRLNTCYIWCKLLWSVNLATVRPHKPPTALSSISPTLLSISRLGWKWKSQFRQAHPISSSIHASVHLSISAVPSPGQVRLVQSETFSFLSQFVFPPPSLLFFLLYLHLPTPTPTPPFPCFHSSTPCVLSSVGQASSECQGEQSARVMTACPSEYTFLYSPAPPPPDPSSSLSL